MFVRKKTQFWGMLLKGLGFWNNSSRPIEVHTLNELETCVLM